MDWIVYILDCDGRYYTGITTDLQRRLTQHRRGEGAKFTRAFRPDALVFHAPVASRGIALRTEAAIKKLTRVRKQALIDDAPHGDQLLERLGIL